MAKLGKFLGAGLGWVVLGPIGALIGFGVGSLIDSVSINELDVHKSTTTRGDFMISLLVLVAAVMKADGKVLKSELNFVKNYFTRQFGQEATKEAMILLRDLLEKDIPLRDVALQIKTKMNYASRLELMHLLFGICNADGAIEQNELSVLTSIHTYIGITYGDFVSLKSMFIKDVDSAYKILEIESTASNEEIKKAYRKLAVKHHPDKVSYLGEDMRKNAEVKFKKINEAYNQLKKQKGF